MPDLISWDWRTTEAWAQKEFSVSASQTDLSASASCVLWGDRPWDRRRGRGKCKQGSHPLPQPQVEKPGLRWPSVSFNCSGFLSSLPPQPIHSECSSGNWSSKTRRIIRDSRAREAGAGGATLSPWPRRAANRTQPTVDCSCPQKDARSPVHPQHFGCGTEDKICSANKRGVKGLKSGHWALHSEHRFSIHACSLGD